MKTIVKSFETGLCDDISASNLRTTLRTPGLTDEELMKQVNELASQQDEHTTKLATEHQKRAKVNACKVPREGGEQRARNPSSDRSQQILSEIWQMKSEINDLKAEPKTLDPSDSTFVSHLTPRQHATVVGLVEKRCTVKGEINGHSVGVLWDTGAQLSKNLSGFVVKDISELLNIKLNLIAANSSEMPHIGWVELNFRLLPYKNDLKVPLLVTE
ncbi:unnamed protein product [Pocillopora meandrina]|uniref:Aspartic peptidase DDI1-type domain-containing protein n=1 Tax=Pocillopora meandrina TaxID=46732 RepID=A0AAU9WRU6_9CNID|nr:unnamed protein product [Pocillopora meandrina]